MALATKALYSARPVLDLDGETSVELTERVLSLVVTETIEGLAHGEIVVGNWGGDTASGHVFNDRSIVDFGSEVAIRLGDGDRGGVVFVGAVSAMEAHYPEGGGPEMVLLAEDRLQELRMSRRTRSFEEVTDSEIIESIVQGHGLTASVDVDGPSRRHVAQLNQSDLAFIRDRARIVDADVWIDGTTVHVVARSRRDAGEVTLTYNSDLLELSVIADLADQRSKVVVSGWDVAAKEAIVATAEVAAIQSELGDDEAGVELLERAFGPRTESIVHTAPATSAEAQSLADAVLRTAARRFMTANGRAEGDCRLRAGTKVTLAGLGEGFNGTYIIVEVEHTYDQVQGFRTRFRAERPGWGPA